MPGGEHQRHAAVHQHQRGNPVLVSMCGDDGDEATHGVAHQNGTANVEPVQDGGQIIGMLGEAPRSRQIGAATTAAKIGSEHPNSRFGGEPFGDQRPRPVRGGDAVHGEDHPFRWLGCAQVGAVPHADP